MGGYRFFMFLLPIWGFFFGFGLGAESVQALFGDAFLSTITSWVVGFVVALVFALCSYLFYFAAVALVGGALGYALAVGILEAIGLPFGLLVWIVGIVVGIIFAIGVIVLNIQKLVVITDRILGAGVIVATFCGPVWRARVAGHPESSAHCASGVALLELVVHYPGDYRPRRAVSIDAQIRG